LQQGDEDHAGDEAADVGKPVLVTLLVILLGACASPAPQVIREPLSGGISLAEARAKPDTYTGRRVRWGGTIAAVDNRKTETRVELVEPDLDSGGRPEQTGRIGGRFPARFSGFVDPAIYSEGRELTVVGTLLGSVGGTIGKMPYL
jgi:outer membrane lipoprotein